MGRGSGASGARGGAASGGGKRSVSEKEFSAKDLKGGKDRIGEPTVNRDVRAYADNIAEQVRPGDEIVVEKQWKNGTTTQDVYTVKPATTQTMLDGEKLSRYDATVKRDGYSGYTAEGFFGYGSKQGGRLADEISEGRSKVKSVKVTVRR